MKRRNQLVDEALRWAGTTEEGGDNRGPSVEQFQRAVDGKADGTAWCMAFVQYCLMKIGGSHLYKSEHCLTVWNKSPLEARTDKPRPGDIVIWRVKGTIMGHTGIVVGFGEPGQMLTVEGNTGVGGELEREGDGVFVKRRAITPLTGRFVVVGFLQPWPEGLD